MKQLITSITYIAISLLALSFTTSSYARIVCWKNNEGVRECGDKVPPEYAQKARKEMSEQGFVIDETERAKTEEEIAEHKRLAAIKAEEERIAAEKHKQDQILLKTFSNVDDIELTRDGKIAAIETSISLAKKRNEKMQVDMDKMLEKAALAEEAGKTPPEGLLKDIESLKRQIKTNTTFIENKRAEQETVKQAYAADIERFKELKGIE